MIFLIGSEIGAWFYFLKNQMQNWIWNDLKSIYCGAQIGTKILKALNNVFIEKTLAREVKW